MQGTPCRTAGALASAALQKGALEHELGERGEIAGHGTYILYDWPQGHSQCGVFPRFPRAFSLGIQSTDNN